MSTGSNMLGYLSDLASSYPIMHDWMEHAEDAIIAMSKVGDLYAIQSMNSICECITPNMWQEIANTSALYGYIDIIQWIQSQYDINWQTVGFIARDAGYPEIAAYADGYEYIISRDDYPLNYGPTGDPMEDRGEWIFDYRMQEGKEEFLPEEPIATDTEDDLLYDENIEFRDDITIDEDEDDI